MKISLLPALVHHGDRRFLAVLAPNPTLAAAYGGLALLILILTSGFAIVRNSIPVYWIWAYYISPVRKQPGPCSSLQPGTISTACI